MINKNFSELSMGEKYQLQKIMKKHSGGIELLPNEQELYNHFSDEFNESEKTTKSKLPIIILLLIISLIAVLRNC